VRFVIEIIATLKCGSEQEFDKRPILCGFPKKHEFGLGDSHALSLEQQVA
jgi:hypothetical protein